MNSPSIPTAQPSSPENSIKCSSPLSITLRWTISRRTAAQLAPAGNDAHLHLELRINPNKDPRWVLVDPTTHAQRSIEHPEPAPQCTLCESSIVLDSASLRAHILINAQSEHTLIYVRTTIFTELNIPGGRYEPVGVQVLSAKNT